MATGLHFVNRRTLSVALLVTGLMASPAVAQDIPGVARPDRPNRALFGGGYGATEQSLVFTGQLGGGVGTNGRTEGNETGGAGDLFAEGRSSASANLDGTLAYAMARRRLSLGASATSSSRYFPEAGGTYTSAQDGRMDLRVETGPRTLFTVSGGASREPLSALSLLPGLEDAAALPLLPLDYGIGDGRVVYVRQDVSADLVHNLSQRASLGVGYHGNRSSITGGDAARWSSGVNGVFTYALARGLALRLGYGVNETAYASSDDAPERRVRYHRIDAGVDFNRALSISRRTTLTVSTGTLVMNERDRRRYEVVGSAILRREIGRSWYSSVAYTRDVELLDVLAAPTFTESVTANINGLLGRRVRVFGDGGGSRGEISGGTVDNSFGVYRAGAGMTVGLTQSLGIGVRYSYFRYRFDMANQVPTVFPGTELSRHAIRVSLDLFAPLYTRARRP